jgi:ubiquinone/menaquinone biosynthesis C-methylase UbiE
MDVGCGTGALLRRVRDARKDLGALIGVDFVIDPDLKDEGIQYFAAKVETLPFPDKAFDTVICTHVIEHIVDYRAAIAELRRVARRRLILVVPREREYRYTFNPHINFFPYTHSFLRAVMPVPESYHIREIGRDIYYREDIAP